jgi:hypothetical protein
MQRVTGNEVALGPATLGTLMLCSWMKRRRCASAFLHTIPISWVGGGIFCALFGGVRKGVLRPTFGGCTAGLVYLAW